MTVADDESPDEGDEAEVEGADTPVAEMAYGVAVSWSRGQRVLHPAVDELLDTVSALRDDGFVTLTDVTAVDYLTHEGPRALPPGVVADRFELVVGLRNHERRERIRLRVQLDADAPTAPTLFDLYPGAETLEREVHDLFGITFSDHPDPTRILMPENWVGHPLRKDYAVGAIPVQFKGAPSSR